MGVSVIVCCFNSSSRISRTLEYLVRQSISDSLEYEIIIVDNCSTDETISVAKREFEKHDKKNIDFRIISEKEPGLANARRAGALAANFEILIFCDDDNWLFPDYVETANRIMFANPQFGILGGLGIVASDVEVPFWFSTFQADFAIGAQSLFSGDITTKGGVWGAGMVLRRNYYLKIINYGFKGLLSDRKGNLLNSGGDTEICKLYILGGYKLGYFEDLLFYHFVKSDRLTKDYVEKLSQGIAESKAVIEKYNCLIDLSKKSIGQRAGIVVKSVVRKLLFMSIKSDNYNLSFVMPGWFSRQFDEEVYEVKKFLLYLKSKPII